MKKTRSIMLAAALVVCMVAVAQKSINSGVYWIDGDVNSAQATTSAIDISSLTTGLHSYTIRVQDSEGLWSSPITKYFVIPQSEKASSIAEREYWIDGKVATRTTLGASPAQINLQDLAPGLHSLTIRVKDDTGKWSSTITKYFVIMPEETTPTIARYMYWIDDDTANLASGALTTASGVLPVDIGALSEGDHTLSWSVADSRGAWSAVKSETFNVVKTAITAEMITLAPNTYVYTGEDIEPEVVVADGTTTLVKGEDYEVAYANNRNVGEATITITGKGAYKESVEVKFSITKADGYISYEVASVNKTYGDAAFTNPLTTVGDGVVAYSTSDANVAAVDEATGEVTIVGAGEAVITATVTNAEGGNYNYAVTTATYAIGVNTAAMQVVATNYTGTYDKAAHGINVTVSVPEGAVVKYGETEGSYTLDDCPTYTNAGIYTIYYQVTKDNYTTVTGSAVVTIDKAAAVIGFENSSVSKTFGDAAFTNVLTNNGDGIVTYETDNSNVATVNAETGEVTITGSGDANITATVTDGTNYTYATKTTSFAVGVSNATMDIAVEGYTGTYDGKAHGITVTVNVPEGAVVKYGTEAGSYTSEASPTFTDAGNYTVYYQVTKQNYNTVTNSAVVAIAKAVGSISYEETSIDKKDTDAAFTNELTQTGDGTVTYMSDNVNVATVDAETGEVTITGIGEATITATVTDGTNYTYTTKTARYTLKVTADPTGVSIVRTDSSDDDGSGVWYSLGGQRLNAKPHKPGIYVRNGRKVMVK